MKKEFKFPTIIGVIVLLVAIGIGVYLTQFRTTLGSKASGSCNPDNVQVTNITNSSANISFITSSPCLITISLANQTISDIHSEPSRLHYFEVKHLSDATDYSFSIISSGSKVDDSAYKFKTGTKPATEIPTSNLAWGKVYNSDKKTPGVAIVYLNIKGSSPLSSVVTTDGNWSISLANSFNESSNDWFTVPTEPVNEDIIVISEDGLATQVVNNSSNNNPVPDITIGQNSLDIAAVVTKPVAFGQVGSTTAVSTQKPVDVINPKNGDMLSTNKPNFFGTAPVNSKVVIEVHSQTPINSETSSNSAGEWSWSPPTNLEPGAHTITVKVQNTATGLWETVTRSFTVLAAEKSSPQYEASGSASTPTPTPTLVPTNTPVPTERVARPSVTVTPPVTGDSSPTYIIVIASVILFFVSFSLIR